MLAMADQKFGSLSLLVWCRLWRFSQSGGRIFQIFNKLFWQLIVDLSRILDFRGWNVCMHDFYRVYSPGKSNINKLPMTPTVWNNFAFILHPPFPTIMRLGVIVNRRVFSRLMSDLGAGRASCVT